MELEFILKIFTILGFILTFMEEIIIILFVPFSILYLKIFKYKKETRLKGKYNTKQLNIFMYIVSIFRIDERGYCEDNKSGLYTLGVFQKTRINKYMSFDEITKLNDKQRELMTKFIGIEKVKSYRVEPKENAHLYINSITKRKIELPITNLNISGKIALDSALIFISQDIN